MDTCWSNSVGNLVACFLRQAPAQSLRLFLSGCCEVRLPSRAVGNVAILWTLHRRVCLTLQPLVHKTHCRKKKKKLKPWNTNQMSSSKKTFLLFICFTRRLNLDMALRFKQRGKCSQMEERQRRTWMHQDRGSTGSTWMQHVCRWADEGWDGSHVRETAGSCEAKMCHSSLISGFV